MTRRRILLLCASLSAAAVSLGFYVPQCLSPVPELVAEAHSLVEPMDEERQWGWEDADPAKVVQMDVLVALVDLSKTGSPLLAGGAEDGRTVCGIVKDRDRLFAVVRALEREACLDIIAEPRMSCKNHAYAVFQVGKGASVENMKRIKGFGSSVVCLPRFTRTGDIDLYVVAHYSEPSLSPFSILEVKASFSIAEGEVYFVGGVKRNRKRSAATGISFLSDAPAFGSLFNRLRETETDQELVLLLTPRIVTGRQATLEK